MIFFFRHPSLLFSLNFNIKKMKNEICIGHIKLTEKLDRQTHIHPTSFVTVIVSSILFITRPSYPTTRHIWLIS